MRKFDKPLRHVVIPGTSQALCGSTVENESKTDTLKSICLACFSVAATVIDQLDKEPNGD